MRHQACVLGTLMLLLAGCQGTNPPEASNTSTPEASAQAREDLPSPISVPNLARQMGSLKAQGTKKYLYGDVMRGANPEDFFVQLERFAEAHPEFAGYNFGEKRDVLLIYLADANNHLDNTNLTAENPKLGQLRKEFLNMVANSKGFPVAFDEKNQPVDPAKLKVRFVKAEKPLHELYRYRIVMTELMYQGLVNLVNIDHATNKINIQVPDEKAWTVVQTAMQENNIPPGRVNVSFGVNTFTKTLFDTFNPPLGGVNIRFPHSDPGTAKNCSLGLPVRINGVASHLTAGHCTDYWAGGIYNHYIYQNANPIGYTYMYENPDPCSFNTTLVCMYTDSMFYSALGSFSLGRIAYTNYGLNSIVTQTDAYGNDAYWDVTSVTSMSGRMAAGTLLHGLGASSGFRDVIVTHPDTTATYDAPVGPDVFVQHLTQVSENSSSGLEVASCGGDSGGPFFQITGSQQAKFAGVMSGKRGETKWIQRQDGIWTPCSNIGLVSSAYDISWQYSGYPIQFHR